jgi:hypothetical protein
VQVAIRVRPPLLRELEGYQPFQNTALVDPNEKILTVSENVQSVQNGGNAADAGLVRLPARLQSLLKQLPAMGWRTQKSVIKLILQR